VPDTVLSNAPGADASILRNWSLPHAHRGAKRFVVLYSREDNVLGPYTGPRRAEAPAGVPEPLAGMLERASRADAVEDLTDGADGRREVGGEALPNIVTGTSVYRLAVLLGVPLVDEVEGRLVPAWSPEQVVRAVRARVANWLNVEENVRRYEEAYRRVQAREGGLPTWDDLPAEVQELFPELGREGARLAWEAARELAEQGREAGLRLRALLEADFESKDIRPALGWAGLKEAAQEDDFIAKMISTEKFVEVNQTPWLKSHSGMLEPTEELREKVYKEEIMQRYILRTTGFGRHKL